MQQILSQVGRCQWPQFLANREGHHVQVSMTLLLLLRICNYNGSQSWTHKHHCTLPWNSRAAALSKACMLQPPQPPLLRHNVAMSPLSLWQTGITSFLCDSCSSTDYFLITKKYLYNFDKRKKHQFHWVKCVCLTSRKMTLPLKEFTKSTARVGSAVCWVLILYLSDFLINTHNKMPTYLSVSNRSLLRS